MGLLFRDLDLGIYCSYAINGINKNQCWVQQIQMLILELDFKNISREYRYFASMHLRKC